MVYQGDDSTEIYPYPGVDDTRTPPGSRSRRLGARAGIAGAVVLIGIAAAAYFGVSALVTDKPFAINGTLQLNSDSIDTSGLPPGFNCMGSGGYDGIGPGAPITVSDEAGTLLAKSTFSGSVGGPGFCVLSFSVNDVPGGSKFYRVEIARRGEMSYTEAEARQGIGVTLGDAKPEMEAAPSGSAFPSRLPASNAPPASPPVAGPVPADAQRASPPSYSTPCTGGPGDYALSNSAVGSSRTSCAFAEEVRSAYTAQPRRGGTVIVSAYSPVTGKAYQMTCVGSGVVTCNGGDNAVVYLY